MKENTDEMKEELKELNKILNEAKIEQDRDNKNLLYQKSLNKKESKENILPKLESSLIEKNENSEEMLILTERLHLRLIGDDIDILYRPNHNYLEFVKNDESGLNRIKELALMSREDFEKYLISKKLFPRITKHQYEIIRTSSLENWFKNAWSVETNKILDKLEISNPIEEPIWRE